MADVFDLLTQEPALYGRIGWQSHPPCNGGSPSKPPTPPPSAAPVRADSAQGEQASAGARNRFGLKKTINPANPLAPKTALGAMGALGSGNVGSGVMVNTVSPSAPKPTTLQTVQKWVNR
jgi:hypothetical protein